jgi:predicted transcriptional regulator
MATQQEVDRITEHLQAKGITVQQIADRLGITRAMFYSTRNSPVSARVLKMIEEIRENYMELLKDLPESKEEAVAEYSEKYAKLLEENNQLLKTENARLAKENEKLMQTISALIAKIPNMEPNPKSYQET